MKKIDYLPDCLNTTHYQLIRGIPRFCPADNYSESFGFQWNQFDRTQLDVYSGVDLSQQRFYAETGWDPKELSDCSVLEVGSGAGRFSEVFCAPPPACCTALITPAPSMPTGAITLPMAIASSLPRPQSMSCPLQTTASTRCSA